jgi:hypothetical protein
MTRRAVQWSRSRQTIRNSSERWKQRSRPSTGEQLGLCARTKGYFFDNQKIVVTAIRGSKSADQQTPSRSALRRIQATVALDSAGVWSLLGRNFEKAAHEVLAASKRHQAHARVSCLSFLRRKPLDELSVSCSRWCDIARQMEERELSRLFSTILSCT